MEPFDYDVIIVGAGPAGCAAAYDLCEYGHSVLMLDKSEFPRMKACAGGLTMKAVKALRYPVGPIVREVCSSARIGYRIASTVRYKSTHPIVAMTVRSEFDDYCLSQTLEKGASLKRIRSVLAIREDAAGIELDTEEGTLSARYLIGADGVNSQVRKLTGQFSESGRGFALEANAPLDATKKTEMTFDLGVVEDGYGWVFPKGDHLNIGLGQFVSSRRERITRDTLRAYADKRLPGVELTDFVGQFISLEGQHYEPTAARVLLAGDSAGFTEPLLGEGIYHAVVSGQAAAEAIRDGEKDGADVPLRFSELLSDVRREIRACRRIASWFYANSDTAYRILRTPLMRYFLVKGAVMGHTIFHTKSNVLKVPFMSIDDVSTRISTQ